MRLSVTLDYYFLSSHNSAWRMERSAIPCSKAKFMHRVGAIPFDIRDEAIALLFVTSKTRGHWILPKGTQSIDETHEQTCRRKAIEEAGVNGHVIQDYPFTIPVTKKMEGGMRQVPVTYYPLFVTEQSEEWPEMNNRQRHWALIGDSKNVGYRDDFPNLIN